MEAADAGKVIAITEGIPVADMIKANAYVKERNARLIDLTVLNYYPGEAKSIMPGFVFKKGTVGIVSKSEH
jgi:succinyl-CoA synthetase alpha subunit